MTFLLSATLLCALTGPANADFDASFSKWATEANRASASTLVTRFIEATGGRKSSYEKIVAQLTERIRKRVGGRTEPKERLEVLGHLLFRELKWRAALDLSDPENLLPHRIVVRKRGYCLGLSLIILDLSERLGWPVVIASAPRHTFIRYQGKSEHWNFETTLFGEIHEDSWYQRRFDLGGAENTPLPSLSKREVAAHLVNNLGYALLEQGRTDDAIRRFEEAISLHDGLVEAHLNLGVAAARRKKWAAALAHFDEARKAWPLDPVLALNRINVLGNAGKVSDALQAAEALLARTEPSSTTLVGLRAARQSWDLASAWEPAQKLSRSLAAKALAGRSRVKGFRGTYYGGRQFEKEIRQRVDTALAFSWRWEAPAPGVPRDNFSIRWTGLFELPHADELSFVGVCSDGIRVRVDGRTVIDAWRVSNDTIEEGSLALAAGLHDIEIEYFESRGDAGLVLLVTAESRPDVIPHESFFFHPGP